MLDFTFLVSEFLKFKKDSKKAIYYKVVLIIVIISNIPALIYFFTYIPGKNLLKETEKISYNFTENDLVLIDQKVSGDSQQMIGAPMNFLFEKNAVYFFNPDDLKQIDTKKYDKIYLISPENNIEYYQKSFLGNRLVPFYNYSIQINTLTESSENFSFPKKEKSITTGIVFEIRK